MKRVCALMRAKREAGARPVKSCKPQERVWVLF